MALKATIHKADLSVADTTRHHYHDYALTVARHPSETEERMMVRLVAFALHAHPDLAFAKGLCKDDEPELWRRDPTGRIEEWIDVGLPDERWLRKASGRASQVFLYAYGGRAADVWWKQNAAAAAKLDSLSVRVLPTEATQALAQMVRRTMRLTATIQEDRIWFADDTGSQTEMEVGVLQAPRD